MMGCAIMRWRLHSHFESKRVGSAEEVFRIRRPDTARTRAAFGSCKMFVLTLRLSLMPLRQPAALHTCTYARALHAWHYPQSTAATPCKHQHTAPISTMRRTMTTHQSSYPQCAVMCTVTCHVSFKNKRATYHIIKRSNNPTAPALFTATIAPTTTMAMYDTSASSLPSSARSDSDAGNPEIPTFGDFTVSHLQTEHWCTTPPIPIPVLRAAAEAHLFRFDPSLPPDFIRERVSRATSALVSRAHLQPRAARRWLHSALRDCAHAYFDARWAYVSGIVDANAPIVARLRRAALCSRDITDAPVAHLSPHGVAHLASTGRPVVVNVYTSYCSKCNDLTPVFEAAASDDGHNARFAAVDASEHPDSRALFGVERYPTVILLDGGERTIYPRALEPTVNRLVAFANGEDPAADVDVAEIAPAADAPEHHALGQWAAMLARQGIDELDALVRDRDILVHMRIDEAIQCGGSACEILPTRATGKLPAVCVLLGGGMGAGKTTAVSAIANTKFWDAHGANVVCVEADAFKEQDPFFHVLNALTLSASRVVHADSIAAAETLFLEAVNRRRDVVFDGTLSWAEYAKQTVAMLRDGEYEYERGEGYVVEDDGTVSETYWRKARRREVPVQPYHIELVAVTVDAPSAVARGVVRQIVSGRGVSVADQLRSHALFSSHFEEYVRIVDAAYLFDMTEAGVVDDDESDDDRSATAEIIAMRPGVLFGDDGEKPHVQEKPPKRPFVVKNRAAYKRFLQKQWMNTQASCADELYQTSSAGSDDSA